MRSRLVAAVCAVAVVMAMAVAVVGCPAPDPPVGTADVDELRRQVAGVRASVEARLATEEILRGSGLQEADVALRLAVPLLLETVSRTTGGYLQEVILELRPDAVVREGDDVHVSVGPVRVRAGRWDLTVTIRRIEARLSAGAPEIDVAEQDGDVRLELGLPIEVLGGSGAADIDFRWDAAGAAAAVCRDFRIRETFAATLAPRLYELTGGLALHSTDDGGVVLEPDFDQRLLVQPEPTPESWRRVREILDREDRIFRCGLALDPADMEARLHELLRRGFRFRLPGSLVRPVRLPGHVTESVTVSARRLRVLATGAGIRLRRDWLWYGLDLELVAAN